MGNKFINYSQGCCVRFANAGFALVRSDLVTLVTALLTGRWDCSLVGCAGEFSLRIIIIQMVDLKRAAIRERYAVSNESP